MTTPQIILITGGAGYIGSHVNKELTKQGYSTVIFDNLCTGHKELARWGVFVLGDLQDIQQLRLVFSKYAIQAVLHFAGHAYVGESVLNPEKYYFNNVVNTLNLLKVMREFQVRHLVFSSTCATYGNPQQIPLTEDHPQLPVNPYGMTKYMIEKILYDYHHAYHLEFVALRYFNAAGADPDGEIGEWHDPETHLIPLIFDVARGKKTHIEIFGNDYPTSDGTCIRDYIHVNDLAKAHILALQYLFQKGTSICLNLGSETGYSVQQVISEAKRITNHEISTIISPRRAGDPPLLVGSSARARQILGWCPHSDLTDILKTAWQWHQKLPPTNSLTKI